MTSVDRTGGVVSDIQGLQFEEGSFSLAQLVMALPADAIQPVSAREVLKSLASFADSGVFHLTQAWLMRATSYSERAVRDALAMLENRGWLTRSQGDWAGGPGRRTCYVVSKQRLVAIVKNDPPPWMLEEVRRPAHAAFIGFNSTQATCSSEAAPCAAGSTETTIGGPANASTEPADATFLRYKERARERARPCPTFHPTFLEYPWPTDEMKQQAVAILAACGSGLADFDRYGARMLGSLEDLLREQWGDPVFLRCKVIPAVMKRTEKASEPEKRIKDFYLVDRNIEERREQRASHQRGSGQSSGSGQSGMLSKGVTFGASVTDLQQKRVARMATCNRVIEIIKSGQRPEWTLDTDERSIAKTDTEAAFARALERHKVELAALETEAPVA